MILTISTMFHLASVWVTSLVLCAETGYLKKETATVGQVILNRVEHPQFPPTILEVVLQPRQFAKPRQCRKMRNYHLEVSVRMHRWPSRRLARLDWLQKDVLFFATPVAYARIHARWEQRGLRVAGRSRNPVTGGWAHYFLRLPN